MRAIALIPALLLALGACQSHEGNGAGVPGDRSDTQPYAGVAADERLRFTGTEPFWGGEIDGSTLIYRTVEKPEGVRLPVSRFNGRGGLSYSGIIDGADFTLAVTPGECSDGMSDRTYPFVATLMIGEATRHGCAWSDVQPFTGPKAP